MMYECIYQSNVLELNLEIMTVSGIDYGSLVHHSLMKKMQHEMERKQTLVPKKMPLLNPCKMILVMMAVSDIGS